MRHWVISIGVLIVASFGVARGDDSTTAGLELVEVKKIWDAAPHNAFTDLIRFQNRWYCTFREGQAHISTDGKLRVVVSEDGNEWKSAALIAHPTGELRDPKFAIMPDGRLMLIAAVRYGDAIEQSTFKTMVWFSDDGQTWTDGLEVGEPDMWIWSVTWQGETAYGVGYGCGSEQIARLYQSHDGRAWHAHVKDLFPSGGYPNESSLVFAPDKTCYCLLRRDAGTMSGQLGVSQLPYAEWKWHDLQTRIGGPKMIQLRDGRLLSTVRIHEEGEHHTSVCWIDAKSGRLTESVKLPSGGGDNSYAGMVQAEDGLVWISYYSGHEGKVSIYLAKVRVSKQL